MSKLKIFLTLTAFGALLFPACNKDDIITVRDGVSVTFAGQILDENGAPLSGALVRCESEQMTTDSFGIFRLKPVKAPLRNAILHVEKPGFFRFSRAYMVQKNAIQTVTLKLIRKVEAGTVGPDGGDVTVGGGPRLSFPPGALARADGSPYGGQARVYATWLAPGSADLPFTMPGDLRGVQTDGQEGVLSTYGMLGVEIEDPAGHPLQVAAGSSVELHMPIVPEQQNSAPATIALWHYDEAAARWMEEGSAQRIGDKYVGAVKHFSFWNCDQFSETVYMDARVFMGETGTPVASAYIKLTVLATNFAGYGSTNSEGWFGTEVPKGYAMKLEIFAPAALCGQSILYPVYSEEIGPFSADADLPDIILPLEPVRFKGRMLDCNGDPVENGYGLLNTGTYITPVFPGQNGRFELNVVNCQNNPGSGTFQGFDLEKLNESQLVSFNYPPNLVDLGDIPVCVSLGEFIRFNLDGQHFTAVNARAVSIGDTTQIHSIAPSDIGIGFLFVGLQPGHYPLIRPFFVQDYHVNAVGDLSTTVTTFAANPGDLIIGTFGGTFKDSNGASHSISGDYRVMRD